MLQRLLQRRATAGIGAGAVLRAAGAGARRAGAVRFTSTLVVPPQYTGIETITRSEVGEVMTRDRVKNILANPPKKRRVTLTDAQLGQAHGRGARKHTVANVWIRPLSPLDHPHICRDLLSPKHPGVCPRLAAGTACYRKHPSPEEIAAGTEAVRNGSGNDIMVNSQPYHEYFRRWAHRGDVTSPLLLTSTLGRFHVHATVEGGGLTGQAQAVRHGLARALQAFDPKLRPALKLAGLLKRDDRVVERKKPGQFKARKRYTWVKR